MALLPRRQNGYEPIVTREMFEPLMPQPENMGGPAPVTLPAASVAPEQMVNPAEFADIFPNGLDQETLAAMLSTAPGAVVSPAASQPGPGAGLVTTPGGEQGFYFYTDRGRLAGYDGKGGFIAADPNAQYRMYDERGKNRIVAEGTGVEALQNIYNIANQFNTEQGKKANWGIERLNPATGQWERISENDPAKNIGGKIADIALPVAGALIAGPLGAAAGSGLSSVAQGRSLEDTLLRAAISGGATFAGGQVLGGAPGGGASGVGGTLGGSLAAAGPAAQAALNATLPGIIVSGALGSAAGSALGSAAGSVLGSALTSGAAPTPAQPAPAQQQPVEITPEGDLILTGTRPAVPTGIGIGAIAPTLPNLIPSSVPTPDVTPEIVVEGTSPSQKPLPVEALIPTSIAPALPNLIPSSVPTPDVGGNSLLDDIIKYYSLGSGALDLLGGVLGGGGGPAATPYVSQLGPAPTFSRGAFRPFAGDYETYGFGPEFNFFGGAPAPTPTAPVMSILPGPRTA